MKYNSDLYAFVKKARKAGFSDKKIRKQMLAKGWEEDLIDEAINIKEVAISKFFLGFTFAAIMILGLLGIYVMFSENKIPEEISGYNIANYETKYADTISFLQSQKNGLIALWPSNAQYIIDNTDMIPIAKYPSKEIIDSKVTSYKGYYGEATQIRLLSTIFLNVDHEKSIELLQNADFNYLLITEDDLFYRKSMQNAIHDCAVEPSFCTGFVKQEVIYGNAQVLDQDITFTHYDSTYSMDFVLGESFLMQAFFTNISNENLELIYSDEVSKIYRIDNKQNLLSRFLGYDYQQPIGQIN